MPRRLTDEQLREYASRPVSSSEPEAIIAELVEVLLDLHADARLTLTKQELTLAANACTRVSRSELDDDEQAARLWFELAEKLRAVAGELPEDR